MLVYFDPWMAGVVLPSLIIVGLIAHPVHRQQPEGQRLLHVRRAQVRDHASSCSASWSSGWSLIVLGTFLRGPNWNFFGPFEFWDLHKLAALTNVNLSEYIWVRGVRDRAADATGSSARSSGILLVLFYVFALPVDPGEGLFKVYYEKLGASRYYVTMFLFLMMMSLPIKMLAAVDLQPEVHRRDP